MADFNFPGTQAPADFYLDIALGRVPGMSSEFIVGITPPAASGVEITVWDRLSIRADIPAPANLYVSSTNAGDTTTRVTAVVLDDEYRQAIFQATVNGQTQVQMVNVEGGNNLVTWVQACRNFVATPLGDIYVGLTSALNAGVPTDTDAIQSVILTPNNVTHNGALMVPEDMAAVFMHIRASTDDVTKPASIIPVTTTFGDPPIRGNTYVVTNTSAPFDIPLPFGSTSILGANVAAFPARTKVEYHATPTSPNTAVNIGADLILVDERLIGT